MLHQLDGRLLVGRRRGRGGGGQGGGGGFRLAAPSRGLTGRIGRMEKERMMRGIEARMGMVSKCGPPSPRAASWEH